MNVRKLLLRSQNLLLNPVEEFKDISNEQSTIIEVNKQFIIPLALLVAILTFIGAGVPNISLPVDSFIFIALNAIIVFLLVFAHAYVSGKSIALLGHNTAAESDGNAYYALSSYSQLPFFLILGLVKLFPSLIFLIFIGLYSVYLFYSGLSDMTKVPVAKRIQFTVLSMLIMIVSFIICSELFTLLYSEILEQFTTFAAI